MKNVEEVLCNTDWPLLQRQKRKLIELTATEETGELLRGLTHYIDALQDAAIEDGIATEAEVFGDLGDSDD